MSKTLLKDCVEILDNRRIPLSSAEREKLDKKYPYYGAQGIIDYVDRYIFDGEFILVAEDGNNLKSLSENIATWAVGRFWVNNHAHILGEKPGYCLRYIYYILNSLDLRGYITGSAQPKFNQENLARVELNLPDYNTQCVIAETLTLIDSKISNNTSICSELEAMAKLLYDYWFVQFDFPDENGKPYKSSGGKMVWNEKVKREIPAEWEVNRLGDLISYNRGVSYTGNDMCDTGTPIISLASIDRSGRYIPEGIKYYNQEYSSSKVLKPYDLVMANTDMTQERAVMGKIIFVPDIFEGDILSTHHITTMTIEDDLKSYLMMTTQTDWFHKYIKGFSSGTNVLGMDMVGFEDYMLLCPSKDILRQFNGIILGIYAKIFEVYKENFELASLRDFLLPMLMNGQVKVKEDYKNE